MEVGIDLRAVYEEEAIYTSEVLAIDEEQTLADVQNAFRNAFNLSVNAAIPTEKLFPQSLLSLTPEQSMLVLMQQ